KYISKAKGVSSSLLISALNILNETEINYRAARNKRLHVELALIRLCYLQQALQVTIEGGLSKKKLVEGSKPVAFRRLKPISIPDTVERKVEKSGEPKLIIETKPKSTTVKMPVAAEPVTERKSTTPGGKISLDAIRNKYKTNGNSNGNINRPLEQSQLEAAWKEYVEVLRKAKNPAAQPFDLAELRIKDSHTFEVVTSNNIEQKFIEQDRNKVFAFLQKKLENQMLQFSVIVEERPSDRPVADIPLTSKDQFQKLVEEFPIVKEMKDRLKLDLDW